MKVIALKNGTSVVLKKPLTEEETDIFNRLPADFMQAVFSHFRKNNFQPVPKKNKLFNRIVSLFAEKTDLLQTDFLLRNVPPLPAVLQGHFTSNEMHFPPEKPLTAIGYQPIYNYSLLPDSFIPEEVAKKGIHIYRDTASYFINWDEQQGISITDPNGNDVAEEFDCRQLGAFYPTDNDIVSFDCVCYFRPKDLAYLESMHHRIRYAVDKEKDSPTVPVNKTIEHILEGYPEKYQQLYQIYARDRTDNSLNVALIHELKHALNHIQLTLWEENGGKMTPSQALRWKIEDERSATLASELYVASEMKKNLDVNFLIDEQQSSVLAARLLDETPDQQRETLKNTDEIVDFILSDWIGNNLDFMDQNVLPKQMEIFTDEHPLTSGNGETFETEVLHKMFCFDVKNPETNQTEKKDFFRLVKEIPITDKEKEILFQTQISLHKKRGMQRKAIELGLIDPSLIQTARQNRTSQLQKSQQAKKQLLHLLGKEADLI